MSQSTKEVTVRAVSAFRQMAPYYQNFNGSYSWSGAWGSGSAGAAFNLGAGASMHLAGPAAVQVVLNDSKQTRSFSVTTSHWFGTTGDTLTVTIPARYAVTPTNLTVTRLSEGSHRVDWIRRSVYTSVIVQRRENGGAWKQILRPSGNIASQTDNTTKAGNKYEYRVAGIGGSGQSGWSNVGTVYTSPTTPTGISATRSGNNIVVNASGRPRHVTGYNIRDGGTQVATNVQLPWTHSNPAAAATHSYTGQARYNSLTSGWSSASNTVQLLSPPLAPTNLSPNGPVLSSEDEVKLAWKHNPVDSSPQTEAEYRHRARGETSWTTGSVTTGSSATVSSAAGVLEWQVRTKGQHPDWSPWSAVATFTLIDPPGVAVMSPEELWTRRTVDVEWSFDQPQGRPQSSWEASLQLAGEVIEQRTGSGPATTASFTTPLVDYEEYEVVVSAAAGNVWSGEAAQSFIVQVPPAAPGLVSAEWNEDTGTVTVEVQDGRGPSVESITNYFENPRLAPGDEPVTIVRNEQRNPRAVGLGCYRAAQDLGTVADLTVRQSPNPEGTGAAIRATIARYRPGKVGVGLSASVKPEDTVPIAASQWIAVRARVAASLGAVAVSIQFSNGAQAMSETSSGLLPVTTDADEGTMVSFFAETPEGATHAHAVVVYDSAQAGVATGEWVEVAAPMVTVAESAALALAQANMFISGDGMESPDVDMRLRFEGEENASPTVLEYDTVRGVEEQGDIRVMRSEFDGKPAIRLVALGQAGSTAQSYARVAVPEALRGSGGVALATRHQLEAFDIAPDPAMGLAVMAPLQYETFTNAAGSEALRMEFGALGAPFHMALPIYGGAGAPDVYYTDIGLITPGYTGEVFSGSSGLVRLGESWMSSAWDGPVDASTSTLSMAPHAVAASIERSVDGGVTWSLFVERAPVPVFATDNESLSNGTTLYRVTTYSEDDASSVVVHESTSDSPSVWLSGGDGFTRAARLPYDPAVSLTQGRERAVRRYAGRPKPVVHAGEAVTRTVDYGGTLLVDEQSPDELADLVADEAPVHLYRDPDGRHVYGAISDVQLTRESHAHWGFGFQLTETEK